MKRALLSACVGGVCLTVALCARGWLQVAATMLAGIAGVMVAVFVFTQGGSK